MEEENGRHGWKLSGDSEGTPQWERAFGPRNLCVVQMSWRDFHVLTSVREGIRPEEAVCCAGVVAGYSWP